MSSSSHIKSVVGIAAAVWFIIALVTGADATNFLKYFSMVASIVTLLFLAYDRFLWRLSVVRRFTGKPSLAGTWRGQLKSSYVRPDESTPVTPIPVVIRVTQSNSVLTVTQFTDESISKSDRGQLVKESDGRWCMSWIYENAPRAEVRDRSDRHLGYCDLTLSGSAAGETLVGQYFTDRNTRGEIEFSEYSKNYYPDAKTALASADFKRAYPFVDIKNIS